jgi:hypothetical protein
MILSAIAFLAFFSTLPPQHTSTLLDKGYEAMYNLDFADAHQCFQQWQEQHPKDAMGPVSEAAAYLFSEFDRLHILQSQFFVNNDSYLTLHSEAADPAVKAKFQADLDKTAQLADSALKQSPKDKHAQLAKVLMKGLDSDYKSLIEKQNVAALVEIKSGTTIAQKLLQDHPDCYDAHLASGIQNYLLSLKSAPVRWILRISGAQTDKETGLANLKIVAEKGRYLKPYANLLLAVAALRDKNTGKAKQILADLAAHFPGNNLYREELKKLS